MTNIEDVEKQFDDLLPWEKREFIRRHLGLVMNTMSDDEIYKTFGVDRDSDINDAYDAVSTSYHCMVYTDNGIYEVKQSGLLFARPELVGRIHEGDTLTVTSRGYDLPQISTYRKIIEIYQNITF